MSILSAQPLAVRARSDRPLAAWQGELRDGIRDPQRLCELLELPPEMAHAARHAAARAARQFPLLAPASFLARIEHGNPADPLLRHVWPEATEESEVVVFTCDPVGDGAAELLPGLLQKYAGRALLIVT